MSDRVTDTYCRVSPAEQVLLRCVESVADSTDRPARALLLQALLQLPRLADVNGAVSVNRVKQLLYELASELPRNPEWLARRVVASPRDLEFTPVDSAIASHTMETFHYLRSPRRVDGRAYGLVTVDDKLIALCVSSPVDVYRLHELLASVGRSHGLSRVISRVFAFDGAPTNSISYMLSRVAQEERRLGVTDLITYVNPNMGFTGSSYRASGWRLLGLENGTRYRYIDFRYITERELNARFGPALDEEYARALGDRFSMSTMVLSPLTVFYRRLVRKVVPLHGAASHARIACAA